MLKPLRSIPWVLTLLISSLTLTAQIGPEGKYLSLNGINQCVIIHNHPDLNIEPGESMTITCRIQPEDFDSLYYIFSKGGSVDPVSRFGLRTYPTSELPNIGFQLVNEQGSDLGATHLTHLGTGEWTHFAWVYNGSKKSSQLFVNGNLLSTVIHSSIGHQTIKNASPLFIGCAIYNFFTPYKSNFWPGQMDEFRIWKRALQPNDIQVDMSSATPQPQGLVAAYDFEEMNGKIIPDISGNNHTALMIGYDIRVFSCNLPVGKGESEERLVGFKINGAEGTGRITSILVDISGTTYFPDIRTMRVYYNGNRERLNLTKATLFGSVTIQKNTSKIRITGDQELSPGENYFWVTADIQPTAREGNQIQAQTLTITKNSETIISVPPERCSRTVLITNKLLFSGGDGGSRHYRIPAIVTALDGSLVTTTDRRWDNFFDLPAHIDVVTRRSTDQGQTWSDPVTIAGAETFEGFGDAALVVNRRNGDIICLFASERSFYGSTPTKPIQIYQSISKDHGVTWSDPVNITSQIYGAACENPVSREWFGAFVTSGAALQLNNGRIMAAMPVRETITRKISNFIIYSDDNAQTWQVSTCRATENGGEAKLVELQNGDVLMSIRNEGKRVFVHSPDKGMSWGTPYTVGELPDPSCNGDIIRFTSKSNGYQKTRILHSIPYSVSRVNVSVLMSYDEGTTWPVRKSIYTGASAYSSLTILRDGTIGLYYEVGEYEHYQMYFVRFSANWLTDGRDKLTDRFQNDITSTNTDLSLQQPFTVYPNPADDHISIAGPLIPGMIIEILNPNGILYKRWIVERESNNINLDISEIPAGLSLVKINETVIKLIVQ